MKKVFQLAVVVFILGMLLAACGGSSKKIENTTTATKVAATVAVASPTATTDDQLGVSGKGCPANITKLTSADLGEALIINICSELAKGNIWGPGYDEEEPGYLPYGNIEPAGTARFDSARSQENTKREPGAWDVWFTISFQDCSDCPRVFSSKVYLVKNLLGEWQFGDVPVISFEETPESIKAKAIRDVKIAVLAPEFTLDMPMESYISIQGYPSLVMLSCQLEDGTGRVVEVDFSRRPRAEEFQISTNGTIPNGVKLRVLAYRFMKYATSRNPYDSDWIYLNK